MILRVVLWAVAFVVPAIAFGVPIPHMPYLLIPALVSVDGFSDGGARRFIIWIGLTLLYEMVYQMPLGIFALTIIIVGVVHVGLAQLFKAEVRVESGRWRPSHLFRSLVVAFLWMAGMILISITISPWLSSAPGLSWQAIWIVWFARGAVLGAVGIMAMILGALFWERTLRTNLIFTDHAIIQTTNLSD